MKVQTLWVLAVLVSSPWDAFATHGKSGSEPLTLEEILQNALEADRKLRERRLESAFTFTIATTSEELDKEAKPKKVETRVFENVPYPGGAFERLIEIDGRPLTEKEQRKEEKREAEFREKLAKGEPPDREEGGRVAFDDELLDRYEFDLQGLENVRGRPAYVLTFRPKPGKLPVRRRIDRALNKSYGTIWIDEASYAISRLEFELNERIRIWWGIIGSISKLKGRIELQALDEETWLPSTFDFYINGRIFFRALHRAEKIRWSGFERVAEEDIGLELPISAR